MAVSKQRKNHAKKSKARSQRIKDHTKRISKKFLENYNKVMEARNQSLNPQTEA
jgi:hypothetical protein